MNALISQHLTGLTDLCHKYGVQRLDLIGSALREDFNPGRSDLDFVVEFKDISVDDAADRYLGLMVDLEDLFGRQVDLVSYRAIQNPYFKQVVDQTRLSLYAA
ncbi:MAG TPA: nucleotidyltransferase domain-containing protein [Tepidisphaeraceae bacterium]|nr:nucleotidyltransferase domain-containing protein [Tepidisphaeraceae bacterium]